MDIVDELLQLAALDDRENIFDRAANEIERLRNILSGMGLEHDIHL